MNLNFGDILVYFACFFGLFTSFYFLLTYFDNKKDLKDITPKNLPKVSILVPAFNEEKTLAKTIESLLALDYPKEKLEIIIIDDGSKDKTFEIAKKYEKENENIIAIHQKNSGKGKALNRAIKISSGEFFGCLDADSFVDKLALRKIISRFKNKKTIAVTPSMKVYNAKNFLEMIQEMEYMLGIFLRKIFSFLGGIHVTPGPFSIFRKSFFEKYGGYEENNPTEDIEIALRIQHHGFHIENALDAHVYTTAPNKFKPLMKQRIRWYRGFFMNLEKYYHLFSIKTGNLGVLLLPSSLISIILAITILIHTLFILSKNLVNSIRTFYNLGWEYVKMFSFNFDWFTIGNHLSFLIIITLIITLTIFIIARKMAGKTDKFLFKVILFSGFYWFFYGIWWLTSIIYKIFGKKSKWGSRKI